MALRLGRALLGFGTDHDDRWISLSDGRLLVVRLRSSEREESGSRNCDGPDHLGEGRQIPSACQFFSQSDARQALSETQWFATTVSVDSVVERIPSGSGRPRKSAPTRTVWKGPRPWAPSTPPVARPYGNEDPGPNPLILDRSLIAGPGAFRGMILAGKAERLWPKRSSLSCPVLRLQRDDSKRRSWIRFVQGL